MPGALAQPVVSGTYRSVEAFILAAQSLVDEGVCAVTTTCGFLVRFQEQLAKALPVPVETSTLMHFQQLQARQPAGGRVAILTVDAASIDADVRAAANIPPTAPIFSLAPDSHFRRAILDEAVALDVAVARREWVLLTQQAMAQCPGIGYWLLECANLPPYGNAIAAATGRPVFDVLTMGVALWHRASGL
ncbi:MAG: aspartate/glutamate racemase family protein [Burkholderiales bacterium]|nr:aspartate/glutamate racemase family protein [Burkholderiales bacterium]